MNSQTALKFIAKLNEKRDSLEQQLNNRNIRDVERNDLSQRYIAITNEIATMYGFVTHDGSTGGLPIDAAAIPAKMQIKDPTRDSPVYSFDAIADNTCNYPLVLSEKTWKHVADNFNDVISDCDEQVVMPDGTMMTMTAHAALTVRVQLNDGSWVDSDMQAYKSDRDVLGLVGLCSCGLLVDAPNRCLMRAIMLGGGRSSARRVDNHDSPE